MKAFQRVIGGAFSSPNPPPHPGSQVQLACLAGQHLTKLPAFTIQTCKKVVVVDANTLKKTLKKKKVAALTASLPHGGAPQGSRAGAATIRLLLRGLRLKL